MGKFSPKQKLKNKKHWILDIHLKDNFMQGSVALSLKIKKNFKHEVCYIYLIPDYFRTFRGKH